MVTGVDVGAVDAARRVGSAATDATSEVLGRAVVPHNRTNLERQVALRSGSRDRAVEDVGLGLAVVVGSIGVVHVGAGVSGIDTLESTESEPLGLGLGLSDEDTGEKR